MPSCAMPVEPSSVITVIDSLLAESTKIIHQIDRLVKKYKDAPHTLVSLRIECSSIESSLSSINFIAKRDLHEFESRIVESTDAQETFDVVLTSCGLVFAVAKCEAAILIQIEEKSVHTLWNDYMRTIWDETRMKLLLNRVRAVYDALKLLLSISQAESTETFLQILQSERMKVDFVRTISMDPSIAAEANVPSVRPPSIFSSSEDETKTSVFAGNDMDKDVYRKAFVNMKRKMAVKVVAKEDELHLNVLNLEEDSQSIPSQSDDKLYSERQADQNDFDTAIAASQPIADGNRSSTWIVPPSKRLTSGQLSERIDLYFKYQAILLRADQLHPTRGGPWSDSRLGEVFRSPEDSTRVFAPPETSSLQALVASLKRQDFIRPTANIRLEIINEYSLFSIPEGQGILDQALITACYRSSLQAANILLQMGANVNCHDKSKIRLTPLMIATIQGYRALTRHLVEWGADIGLASFDHAVFPRVRGQEARPKSSNLRGNTLRGGLTALGYAVLLERPLDVAALREHYAKVLYGPSIILPIQIAVIQGDLERCKELERYRRWADMEEHSAFLTLKLAAQTDYADVLLWLLRDRRAMRHMQAEKIAPFRNLSEIRQSVCDQQKDFFDWTKKGQTTLDCAIRTSQYKNAQTLIAEGADVSMPEQGSRYFAMAWITESQPIIEALLEKIGPATIVKNVVGILHIAVTCRWEDSDAQCRQIRRLLEFGANPHRELPYSELGRKHPTETPRGERPYSALLVGEQIPAQSHKLTMSPEMYREWLDKKERPKLLAGKDSKSRWKEQRQKSQRLIGVLREHAILR